MVRESGDENALWWRIQRIEDQLRAVRSQLASTHAGGRLVSSVVLGNIPPGSLVGPTIQMFTNSSGSSLEDGDVVVLEASGARLTSTTSSNADVLAFGVVRDVRNQGPFADAGEVPVLLLGNVAVLNVTGAVAAGDYLTSSTTPKLAESIGGSPGTGAFAIAETVNPGGVGSVAAFVFGMGGGGGGSGAATRYYVPFGSDVTDGQS